MTRVPPDRGVFIFYYPSISTIHVLTMHQYKGIDQKGILLQGYSNRHLGFWPLSSRLEDIETEEMLKDVITFMKSIVLET